MAITIIFGLGFASLLTLVLPVMYSLVFNIKATAIEVSHLTNNTQLFSSAIDPKRFPRGQSVTRGWLVILIRVPP